jgi:hypothetical protein
VRFVLKTWKQKAQTWSFDLLIAVVLFIIIVAIFYAFLSTNKSEDATQELQSGAKTIGYYFNCDVSQYSRCFIQGGKINEQKLEELLDFIDLNLTSAYATIKKELGLSGDFCIYFRDKNGYLVPIDVGEKSYTGIGESTFMLNDGLPCGMELTS